MAEQKLPPATTEETKPAEVKQEEPSLIKDLAKQAVDSIIVPKLKETAVNTFSELVYMIADAFVNVFSRKVTKTAPPIRKGGSSYSSLYKSQSSTDAKKVRSSEELVYCVVKDKQKADAIKAELTDMMNQYHKVRTADLYERCGVATQFNDYNFGWTNLSDIRYVINRDGYWFDMPKPVRLN